MKDDSTIYHRAAILLQKAEFSKDELAELLECAPSTAENLRSYFKTCAGIPEVMREKANAASRESKRRAKVHLKQIMESGDPEVVFITKPWKYSDPHGGNGCTRPPA